MRVLVTGANGFLGKNLQVHLLENKIETVVFNREMAESQLAECLSDVDFVFHLAGVNRPLDVHEFSVVNAGLTIHLCDAIRNTGRQIPLIFASSIQAESDNSYGLSKLAAEQALVKLESETGSPVYIYRLPNVFGKWSRPNYNSAVATFCYNVANDLPISINDPDAKIRLVYIDDVISSFLKVLVDRHFGLHRLDVAPAYTISVGDLAREILAFKESRNSLTIDAVGKGITRALYSTYLSYLKPSQFSSSLKVHSDSRGRFVEMLKTKDSGQFSFFTAHPGITRGGHYHHTKNERFLVIQGKARFGFRHILTGDDYEIFTTGEKPEVVETVPGWSHDIKNVGDNELIVMLWANETFDPQHPDTVTFKV